MKNLADCVGFLQNCCDFDVGSRSCWSTRLLGHCASEVEGLENMVENSQ